MLRIMGSRIELVEDQLAAVRFSRAARRGATGVEFEGSITGHFAGPHNDMAVLNKNLNGLNDLRLSEIPITSERFPDSLNGWYRINAVTTTLNRLTPKTSRLSWNLRTTRIRGEFDIYMAGVTRANEQGRGGILLNGVKTIGVPAAAQGQFFPAAAANTPNSATYLIDTRWGRNGQAMRVYTPTGNIADLGFRYALKATDGDLGQCLVDINGEPTVGLVEQPFLGEAGESWLISNGLITIGQDHGQDIWVTFANAVNTYRWRLNFTTADGTLVTFPSKISVTASNYYTVAIRLALDKGKGQIDSSPYIVLRRGARFAIVGEFRGRLRVEGSRNTAAPYITQTGSSFSGAASTYGVLQLSGNNPTVSTAGLALTDPFKDVAYLYVDGTTKSVTASETRHREFLGAVSQRIRTIL